MQCLHHMLAICKLVPEPSESQSAPTHPPHSFLFAPASSLSEVVKMKLDKQLQPILFSIARASEQLVICIYCQGLLYPGFNLIWLPHLLQTSPAPPTTSSQLSTWRIISSSRLLQPNHLPAPLDHLMRPRIQIYIKTMHANWTCPTVCTVSSLCAATFLVLYYRFGGGLSV